ncbi:MAG TPA: amidase family protein, partial [Streptomyces sp.]
IPAAWCGVFGLKTTNGLLPSPDRTGLASPGVLTATAAEALPYLRHVLGRRGKPPAVARLPVPAAYSPDLGFAEVDPAVAAVVRTAVDHLACAEVVRLAPAGRFALLDPAEAWTAVRAGSPPPAMRALRAENDALLDAFFARTPLLLTPTTPNLPHGHDGPGDTYSTALTWAFNLSGHPAASVPAGFGPDGCPVGLQLVARRGADAELLAMARAVESALPAFPRPLHTSTWW